MKKIYLITALAFGTLATANAQVVFSTSFETWAAGAATDFGGTTSNIGAANITQVTGQSDYGNSAVRLTNATTTHKRYTTLPMTVENTKTYEIKFWVKGQGDIRTSLFDGRSTGFGYATYNPYIAINSTSWTMQTQTITCENDTVAGEFIFSVRSTVAANHIMLDSVVISEVTSVPTTVSIYAIQYTTGSGPSPLVGQTVNTGGIVSAVYPGGYFLQSGPGAWRGIEVSDAVNAAAIGDSVTLSATVQENFLNTRLTSISSFVKVSSSNPLPAVAIINTTQGNSEAYEGVYARVTSRCSDDNAGFGMWEVYSSPDSLKIDDMIYAFPSPVFNQNYQITGVISYNFSEFKLNPRSAADVVTVTGINENEAFSGIAMFPNPANNVVNLTNLPANTTVNVVDLTGKTVYTTAQATINTADLANGAYLVKLVNTNGTKTLKLVVKH